MSAHTNPGMPCHYFYVSNAALAEIGSALNTGRTAEEQAWIEEGWARLREQTDAVRPARRGA